MLVIAVRTQTVGLLCVFLLQWKEAAEADNTQVRATQKVTK